MKQPLMQFVAASVTMRACAGLGIKIFVTVSI